MTGHRPRRPGPAPGPTILIAALSTAAQAGPAIAAGADMIDATGLSDQAVAGIRARHPGVRLWAGAPAAVDADATDATTAADATTTTDATKAADATTTADATTASNGQAMAVAAVVARAAVLTWLGTPAIRTRHVLPVRRAIDMTSSIAGTRLPSLTTRGLG